MTADAHGATPASRHLRWAGLLLGFSLGGFFDGILLHQVLQWHHLLSNVQAAALQDLRAQLLADGLFHVLMYFIAAWALYLLWKGRMALAAAGAERQRAAILVRAAQLLRSRVEEVAPHVTLEMGHDPAGSPREGAACRGTPWTGAPPSASGL